MNNEPSNKQIQFAKLMGHGTVFFIILPIIAFWTQHNLDFWLTHFKGAPVHIGYFVSFLLSFLLMNRILALNTIAMILVALT